LVGLRWRYLLPKLCCLLCAPEGRSDVPQAGLWALDVLPWERADEGVERRCRLPAEREVRARPARLRHLQEVAVRDVRERAYLLVAPLEEVKVTFL
jgi:hypothetical protein